MSSNEELDSNFRQKIDMSTIFNRQVDRKNLAGSYDYPSAIGVMLNNLPIRYVNWVIDQDELYVKEVDFLTYKTVSGVRVGYKDDPLVWNKDRTELGLSSEPGFAVYRLPDDSIDWSDSRIYSPCLVREEIVDYEAKDRLVSMAGEIAKLTWTIDPLEQDAGDNEEHLKRNRKKTSLRLPLHFRKLLKKALEMEEKGLLKIEDEKDEE